MSNLIDLWESPQSKEMYLIAGWRQWADAGAVSSRLPVFLMEQLKARPIGKLNDAGYYLFQVPGTHDLLRPVIRYEDGLAVDLETTSNTIHFAGDEARGLVFFSGDEPQVNVETYAQAFIEIARTLNVRRIVSFGGVYGEIPYDKERTISSAYSLPGLKEEVSRLGVNLSDYHGGASIDSVLCKRAGEAGLEYITFYAFVPTYDFSSISDQVSAIRIENDFAAWLAIMRRVNTMLKLNLDLYGLEVKSAQLKEVIDEKIADIEKANPGMGVREYLQKLNEDYEEPTFNPTDDFWEEKLRGLFDEIDPD